MSVHRDEEIVPLDAGGGEAEGEVAVAVLPEDVLQGGLGKVGLILDGDFLPTAGNEFVVGPYDRKEIFGEAGAGLVHGAGGRGHPGVEDGHQVPVGRSFLEHAVALGQEAVVRLDGGEVVPVHLRKDAVRETAALLAGLAHQGAVPRGDHHDREEADVLGNASVGFVVPHQFLFPFSDLDGKTRFQAVVHRIRPADGEPFRAVPPVAAVGGRKGALGHRQVVDRIQQVRLSFPVVPADAIDIRRERQFLEGDVAEILDDYFLESWHGYGRT